MTCDDCLSYCWCFAEIKYFALKRRHDITIITIFICTHSCSKINYNNENIKGKNKSTGCLE